MAAYYPDICVACVRILSIFPSSGGTMARKRRGENKVRLDEVENRSNESVSESAGQSGDLQGLSTDEDVSNESVEELVEDDQALEAAEVEGVEDADDHPERPVHTHDEYGRPEDVPRPKKRSA
jgi:hypothetical protein